jgi:VanZ family protein
MKFTSFIPAIIWFIISTILLALPGNDLPQSSFFDFPYFDKIVHFTMFFLLTVFFSYPFAILLHDKPAIKSWFISIALYALAYGIVMEFVQKYFVPGRAFEVADIMFDGFGSSAGMLSMMLLLKKK